MSPRLATGVVFATSFCVLVLEILAGRLLAPIIGVSLETFTGIIGTILAGIALGTAVGGRLADRSDPAPMLGPLLVVGGVTTWAAPLIVATLGPMPGADPVTIVLLTAVAFFAPAVVLSAVSPMVAKLVLDDLGDTGRIVGNLSAAGTLGALVGTFLTGFVLVAALPTRTLIVAIGAALVVGGVALMGVQRIRGNVPLVVLLGLVGVGAAFAPSRCDAETAYACVEFVADPDRPSGVGLVLNGTRNSYVDLDDPSYLQFRYMRLFADVTAALPAGELDVLHLGGAGFTYPRHVADARPGSTNLVLEIDAEMVELASRELGLVLGEEVEVITGDARLSIAELADDRFHLIVGDAFSGLTVPWHLTTEEFVDDVDRVLTADGIVVVNLIDGGDIDFVRAELATYATRFGHVALIAPPGGLGTGTARNLILMASHRPLPPIDVDPADGEFVSVEDTAVVVADAQVLRDDYAPVDQLRQAG